MPVIINSAEIHPFLPSLGTPLAIESARAEHQDIRPLEIAIINLMADKQTTERQLALWLWRERVWLCGLAAWRDVREPVDAGVVEALRGRLASPVPPVISEAKRIVTALFAVLREVDGPCRLGETVTIVADLLGIPERMNAVMGERAPHAAANPGEEAHTVHTMHM